MFIMDNLQLLILCGGLSTRINKLTKRTPKSLLKFKKKPFIFYQLEWLKKNNIKRVILLTGYLENQIKKYVKEKFRTLDILFVKDGKNLRGTAGTILNAKKYLDNYFLVMNGDTFPLIKIKYLFDTYYKNKKLNTVVIKKNNKSYLQSNIKIKKKLITFYEKDKTNSSKFIDYGIQLFNKKDFLNACDKKSYQMIDNIYIKLIKKKKLTYYKTNKNFFEIGSYKGIKEFKNYLYKK